MLCYYAAWRPRWLSIAIVNIKGESNMATEKIAFWVPESVVEALRAKATERWMPLSQVAKLYVVEGLARDGSRPRSPGPVRRRRERQPPAENVAA
jgi:hypothetical protein